MHVIIVKNKWTGSSYFYPLIYQDFDSAKHAIDEKKIPQAKSTNNILTIMECVK